MFTHKHHTDISYLACAARLIGHHDVIYPQFATHNAGTIAAILQMARKSGAAFEMQRLHGMGEGVYREVLADGSVPCRVYAPVGEHRDLLAYLVRRLLENGANSSFVHQLADAEVAPAELLASPLAPAEPWASMPNVGSYVGGDIVAGMLALHVALDTVEAPVQATVWDDTVKAYDMGDLAAQWFSDFLPHPVRLVRFDPDQKRLSDPGWTGDLQAENAFSDGFPLLVASTAGLAELNRRLAAAGRADAAARARQHHAASGHGAHAA